MKHRKIYILGIILALSAVSLGTVACGNKGDAGTAKVSSTGNAQSEKVEDKKVSEQGSSNKTDSNTGSTASNTSSTASNTEANGEASEELDYANMTAEDLIKDFTGKEELSDEDYLWLISTYRYVPISDDLTMSYDNITNDAFKLLSDKKVKYSCSYENKKKLIASEYPQLRGIVLQRMESLLGKTEEDKELAKELVKTETEPFVIKTAVRTLGNSGKDPEVGKFLIAAAKHENPIVRATAASWIGSSWNKGMEGAVEAELELMKDENPDVAKTACGSCGSLTDKRILAALKEILDDGEKYKLHSGCVDSLTGMWLDYPFHKETNEKAYKICMDYYKKTPRAKNTPYWATISSMNHSAKDTFGDWKKKAKYYNPKDIVKAMTAIIKDPEPDFLCRTTAINAIEVHGGEKALKALKPVIKKLKDDNANYVKDIYKKALEKYK